LLSHTLPIKFNCLKLTKYLQHNYIEHFLQNHWQQLVVSLLYNTQYDFYCIKKLVSDSFYFYFYNTSSTAPLYQAMLPCWGHYHNFEFLTKTTQIYFTLSDH